MIRRFDAGNASQAQFFYQAILERLEEPLDASLGLRTVRCNPFDPQLTQSPPELRARFFSPQLFGKRIAAGRVTQKMLFLSV